MIHRPPSLNTCSASTRAPSMCPTMDHTAADAVNRCRAPSHAAGSEKWSRNQRWKRGGKPARTWSSSSTRRPCFCVWGGSVTAEVVIVESKGHVDTRVIVDTRSVTRATLRCCATRQSVVTTTSSYRKLVIHVLDLGVGELGVEEPLCHVDLLAAVSKGVGVGDPLHQPALLSEGGHCKAAQVQAPPTAAWVLCICG